LFARSTRDPPQIKKAAQPGSLSFL
jgi:hypothetical protein